MLPEAEIVVGNSNLKGTMQIKPEAAGDGHQYFAYTCNKESIQIKPQAARNGFVPQINAAAAGNRNHYVLSKFQKEISTDYTNPPDIEIITCTTN